MVKPFSRLTEGLATVLPSQATASNELLLFDDKMNLQSGQKLKVAFCKKPPLQTGLCPSTAMILSSLEWPDKILLTFSHLMEKPQHHSIARMADGYKNDCATILGDIDGMDLKAEAHRLSTVLPSQATASNELLLFDDKMDLKPQTGLCPSTPMILSVLGWQDKILLPFSHLIKKPQHHSTARKADGYKVLPSQETASNKLLMFDEIIPHFNHLGYLIANYLQNLKIAFYLLDYFQILMS